MTDAPTPSLAGIILAAGKGTRMKSSLPKVLHSVAGEPMLVWVLEALKQAGVEQICTVLSEDLQGFESFLKTYSSLSVAIQKNRLGTGDAVASAAFCFAQAKQAPYAAGHCLQGGGLGSDYVLICAGDTPAIAPTSLQNFINKSLAVQAAVSVLGMRVPQPFGYGRLITDGEELQQIIEEKDADPQTRAINICNSGVIFARTTDLFELLAQLTADNAQHEYYLTDIVKLAHGRGLKTSYHVDDEWESFAGVNDRTQLAQVETWIIEKKLAQLQKDGVALMRPQSMFITPKVIIGNDTLIEPNVTITGQSRIGRGCFIGAGCRITDTHIDDGAHIGAGSVIEGCMIKPKEQVLPLSVRLESKHH